MAAPLMRAALANYLNNGIFIITLVVIVFSNISLVIWVYNVINIISFTISNIDIVS